MTQPASAALSCARVRVLLEPFVDGELRRANPVAHAAVTAHLAGCADCRRQHEQAVSLPFRLKALASPAPPEGLVPQVMLAIAPARVTNRRAWVLLAPEMLLVAFILWYVSGLDGLTTLASGIFNDLQSLVGWSSGVSALPSLPAVDVLLLAALIALAVLAAYHLSILIDLDSIGARGRASRLGEHRHA